MNEIIAELRNLEPDYVPAEQVREALASVTMVPLVGPLAVGKSACMAEAVKLDPEFGRVQSFTTRDRRPDEKEDEYRWYGHTPASLSIILGKVRAGELVQYAIHPTTGVIYGSELEDFSRSYAMLDTLSNAAAALRQLPFKEVVAVAMVTDIAMWQAGLEERGSEMAPEELKKRIAEAHKSLAWSLDQGDDIAWLHNEHGKLPDTARQLIAIARGEHESDVAAREVGKELLNHIDSLL